MKRSEKVRVVAAARGMTPAEVRAAVRDVSWPGREDAAARLGLHDEVPTLWTPEDEVLDRAWRKVRGD